MNFQNPAALPTIEASYVGSFIKVNGIKRTKNFWTNRTRVIKPEYISNESLRAMLVAIDELNSKNVPADVGTIAREILTQLPLAAGIDPLVVGYEYAVKLTENVARLGAITYAEFRKAEDDMIAVWQQSQLTGDKMAAVIESLEKKYSSPVDRALALRKHIDSIVGEAPQEIKTLDGPQQIEVLETLAETHRANLGKPLFTFPPEWGLNKYITMLPPGFMASLGGLPGDGKSSLAMQFADYAAMCGRDVLVIHMEDTHETLLMRQTCRHLNATMDELYRGDPEDKMKQMAQLRQSWEGTMTLRYMGGSHINVIIDSIREWADEMSAVRGTQHFGGVVIMDYFQKATFSHSSNRNLADEYSNGVEGLKQVTETKNLFTMIVTQLTVTNGEVKPEGTTQLTKRCQIVLNLKREVIKDSNKERKVMVPGHEMPWALAFAGERDVWGKLSIDKANQHRQGQSWLFMEGPSFKGYTQEWHIQVSNGLVKPNSPTILQPWSEADEAKAQRRREAYHYAVEALHDPDEERRKARQGE